MMAWVKGLDLSFSPTTPEWWARRRTEGYEIAGQCLWTGGYQNNDQLREVAEPNLRYARESGFTTFGYVNAGPWFAAEQCIAEAKRNAGAEWEPRLPIAVDVEIDGVAEDGVQEMCEGLHREIDKVCIYSARWFWVGHLGDPQWDWLVTLPLWVAQYDGRPDLEGLTTFGPWQRDAVVGKQYRGTTVIEDVAVDLNVFDGDWFIKKEEQVEEERTYSQAEVDSLQDAMAELVSLAANFWHAEPDRKRAIASRIHEILTFYGFPA